MTESGEILLIAFLPDKPIFKIVNSLPSEFILDKSIYKDCGLGEWLLFYDWLRSDSTQIGGIRFSFHDEAESPSCSFVSLFTCGS